MTDAQDVALHAELLVTDYLKSWHCSRALDAFSRKLVDRPAPSTAVNDRHNADVARRDKATDWCASLLEFMARSAQQDSSNSTTGKDGTSAGGVSSHRRRSNLSGDSDAAASMGEWTKHDVSALKKAIKQTAQFEDKNERWKQIAALLGNSKTKKQCYLKYKQLKEEQKAAASATTTDPAKKSSRSSSSSSRRRSVDDSAGRRDSIESCSSDVAPQSDCLTKDPVSIDPASKLEPREKDATSVKTAHGVTRDGHTGVESSTFVPVVSRSSSTASETLEMEDCEDFDAPILSVPTKATSVAMGARTAAATRASVATTREGVAPTADQVSSVRQLLFGSQAEGKIFSSHWEEQVHTILRYIVRSQFAVS